MASSSPAKPRIAYQNLFEDSGVTVTPSTETAGYEGANAYDWLTATSWKPTATGDSTLQAVLSSSKPANYFAFYNQTLYSNGGSIKLQYSLNSGGAWSDATAAFSPSDNKAMYFRFPAITTNYWRVLINSNPVSYVGHVQFGMDFELERGCMPGFTPPLLGRDTAITNTVSQTGAFLGRTLLANGARGSINIDKVTTPWVRTVWLPFVLHAERKPFMFLHDPQYYPGEAAFCWSDGAIENPKHTKRNLMSGGIKYKALTS